jgi:hypothetical protein
MVDGSPEKVGGGGSIPSMATIFSSTYRPPDSQFHSSSFQFQRSTGFYLKGGSARLEWPVLRPQDSRSREGKMKVAIYVRVSTVDQNQELQLRELQDYATRHQ